MPLKESGGRDQAAFLFQDLVVEGFAGQAFAAQGGDRFGWGEVKKAADQAPLGVAGKMAMRAAGDDQYRVAGLHFIGARHLALTNMELLELFVQFPGLGLEFVASAHGGISGEAIYSSLYSIYCVHKEDFLGE